jgi:3-oxoacyl-[acyl-carrier protein] reductase
MTERKAGAIVNVSSIAGYNSFVTGAAYCASKHALEGMSKCLRDEVRSRGIRVTLVCPGSVGSKFFHESDGDLMGEDRSKDQDWMISPGQIARTIASVIECEAGSFIPHIEIRPLGKSMSAGR